MALAVDFSSYTDIPTPAQIECWKNQGVRRAIIGTAANRRFADQAQACLSGGLFVQAYCFLYANMPGDYQVARALEKMDLRKVQKVWLDVEQDPDHVIQPPAIWLRCISEARRAAGPRLAGIYTSVSQWALLTGDSKEHGDVPLWDARYQTTVAPFSPYGGWTERELCQYAGSVELCGVNVDMNEEEAMQQDVRDAFTAVLGQLGDQNKKLDELTKNIQSTFALALRLQQRMDHGGIPQLPG